MKDKIQNAMTVDTEKTQRQKALQTLLGKGVDSLYLYLSEHLNFSRIEYVGQQLRIGESALLCGLEFERDKAYSKAYAISLRHGVFLFYLNCASMYIKGAALAFELYGFAGTLSHLFDILDRFAGGPKRWEMALRVSRIDVFADFEFDQDFDSDRFKTKLRRKGIFISGRDSEGKTYYFGDRSRFCIRLYVKSTEIKYSGKTYLRSTWKERGIESDTSKVWRLEFEYRRRKLEKLFDTVDLQKIGGHLHKLWAHGIEKLTYMESSASHTNLYRQDIHPLWQSLRQNLFKEYDVQREDVRHADIEYRRKRALTWLCSHSVAIGETFDNLPEILKKRYKITDDDYERAASNYRLFSWL